jgi:hypothetical protein
VGPKTSQAVTNITFAPDGDLVFTQPHVKGTEHATAFLINPGKTPSTRERARAPALSRAVGGGGGFLATTTTTLHFSTSTVLEEGEGSAMALAAVCAAAAVGMAALTVAHRNFWPAGTTRRRGPHPIEPAESNRSTGRMHKIAPGGCTT